MTLLRGQLASLLAFALGVGVYHLPAAPLSWSLLAWIGVLALAAALWTRSLAPIALAAGLAWAAFSACTLLCAPFPDEFARKDLVVEGRIHDLPDADLRRSRFLLQVEQLRDAERPLDFSGLIRLSWYRDVPPLRAGQRWRLHVRLKPAHGFANPGGFDFERWLFAQGIGATGSVRLGERAVLLDEGPGGQWLARLRQGLRERLRSALAGAPGVDLVVALVLGDRSGLTPERWGVLRRTGTGHLIAISGLHIGLVAGVVFFLGRWLWSRSSSLCERLAAPRAAAVGAMLAALVYSGLAGFAVSTQRALIMLAVLLGALLLMRTPRPFAALALALVGVLAVDPHAVLSAGFWLSFGAVAVLLHALTRRVGAAGFVWRWVRPQWAVALGLLPLLLWLFGRASLVAPAVNLVVVPLFGLLLPAVLVAAGLSLACGIDWPLIQLAALLDAGVRLLGGVAEHPLSSLTLGARPTWVWLAALLGMLLLLGPRGLPGRWLAPLMLAPLLLVKPPSPPPGQAWLTLLDVGQGLAVAVRTAAHVLVYDTGPRFPSGFNTGDAVVVPFLQDQGVRRVDQLVVSHGDRDHAGGVEALLARLEVGEMLAGEPGELGDLAASASVPVRPCRAGQRWVWDGVIFEILYPSVAGEEGNNASCVLRVSVGGTAVLLPGDIEARVERVLVRERGGDLQARVLVAAHHGSATSSSAEFLQTVRPDWVLFAAGYANHFGFPAAPVRERVDAVGSASLATGISGAISFRLLADGALEGPWEHREHHRRLWTHRPPK